MSSAIPKVYVVPATGIATVFSRGPNYGAAREGTGTKEIRTGTQDYVCGQGLVATLPEYIVDQLYIQFDLVALSDALNDTGTIGAINLEIESVAGVFTPENGSPQIPDEFWVACVSAPSLFPVTTGSFVPGSQLPSFVAGRTQIVRAQDYETNGHNRFRLVMGLDEVAVRNGLANGGQFVLFMEWQRDNVPPTGFYPPSVWADGISLLGTVDWTDVNNLRLFIGYLPVEPPSIDLGCTGPTATTYNQFNTMALTWTILPGAGVNPNGCRLALYTTPPTRAAEGTRPVGGAYADVDVPDTVMTDNLFLLGTLVTFPTATADWGDITHWGLVGRNAGELLVFGEVEGAPITVRNGDAPQILVNNFSVSCNGATGSTNFNVASVVFDRVDPATLWTDYGSTPRTMRLGLLRQSGAELVGDTYARQNATFSQVGDYAQNDALVTFPTSTVDWESVHYVGIFDPSDDELRFVVTIPPRTCLAGTALTVAAGAVKVGWI